jgi:hypothetical protein
MIPDGNLKLASARFVVVSPDRSWLQLSATKCAGLHKISLDFRCLVSNVWKTTPRRVYKRQGPRIAVKIFVMSGSDVQGLEIGNTLASEVPGLFNEIVFNAAHLCRGEGFDPVDAALAECHLRALRLPHIDVL